MPKDAVMERKMFKAENNLVVPAIAELRGSFNSVVKLPSSVLSIISLVTMRTSNHVLNSMLTYEKFQLVATKGLTILRCR